MNSIERYENVHLSLAELQDYLTVIEENGSQEIGPNRLYFYLQLEAKHLITANHYLWNGRNLCIFSVYV